MARNPKTRQSRPRERDRSPLACPTLVRPTVRRAGKRTGASDPSGASGFYCARDQSLAQISNIKTIAIRT